MAREAKDFGLKIGDILSAGWGYEAELYNFYEVVGFTKTLVKVRELKKVGAEGKSSYPMYYGRLVKPVTVGDDRFVGETFARKPANFSASDDPSRTFLAIDSFRYAYPWDGEPCDEYNAPDEKTSEEKETIPKAKIQKLLGDIGQMIVEYRKDDEGEKADGMEIVAFALRMALK